MFLHSVRLNEGRGKQQFEISMKQLFHAFTGMMTYTTDMTLRPQVSVDTSAPFQTSKHFFLFGGGVVVGIGSGTQYDLDIEKKKISYPFDIDIEKKKIYLKSVVQILFNDTIFT